MEPPRTASTPPCRVVAVSSRDQDRDAETASASRSWSPPARCKPSLHSTWDSDQLPMTQPTLVRSAQLPDRSASDLVRPMPDVQPNQLSDLDHQADHKGALDHVPLHWRRAAGTDDLVPAMPPPTPPTAHLAIEYQLHGVWCSGGKVSRSHATIGSAADGGGRPPKQGERITPE